MTAQLTDGKDDEAVEADDFVEQGTAVAPGGEVASDSRDGFLDVVRSLSILRVVLWHTFGAAWITYFVSAVPAMFFVTGSLLARSFDRRGAKATLIDRGRRLLVPLWLFTATSWFVMAIANRLSPSPKTALPWAQLLWWILPLDDPRGSLWEAGWLSSPLWYLRAMTWLLLVAPLLRRVSRRRSRATRLR